MSEWWSYTLSDFLLFSPRVYYRMLELHNRELWPAHLLTGAGGIAVIILLRMAAPAARCAAFAALGLAWIWVGWSFVWERYAAINWAAVYVAPAFVLEGLLLIAAAGLPGACVDIRLDARATAAWVLLALGVIAYPVLAPTMGRSWLAAESVGMMPDPTAIATLAALATTSGRARWLLMLVPAVWCLIAGATLLAMDSGDFVVPPLAAALALVLALRRRSAPQA